MWRRSQEVFAVITSDALRSGPVPMVTADLEREVVRATHIFRTWRVKSKGRDAFCSKKNKEMKDMLRVSTLWKVAYHGGVRRTQIKPEYRIY